ncbi:MAG: hypothetical protein ACJAVK_001250 [Akkermansiaceae bacterium]|jgi:hypothetical protein
MKARKFIARLRKKAGETLRNPKSFFDAHREIYLQIAKTSARQTLASLKPSDESSEDWNKKIDTFTRLIFTKLLTSPTGIRIGQGGFFGAASKDTPGSEGENPFTEEEVRDWVNQDKNLDDADIKKGKERTATAIEHVLRHHFSSTSSTDSSGLVTALAAFLENKEGDDSLSKYSSAIARAWSTIFAARFPGDLKKHYTKRFRDITAAS